MGTVRMLEMPERTFAEEERAARETRVRIRRSVDPSACVGNADKPQGAKGRTMGIVGGDAHYGMCGSGDTGTSAHGVGSRTGNKHARGRVGIP